MGRPQLTDDPYEALGVSPDASADELKKAYRAAARAWHPDRNPAPEAAERFKAIARAWELVSDPVKRRAHDLRRGRVTAGGLPEEFLEHVASSIERAQDWIEGHVLPHYADGWRGVGAEMAARFVHDLATLSPTSHLRPTRRGRRWAKPWIDAVHVSMDDRPSGAVSMWMPRRNRHFVVIFPHALWTAGFRDPVELDDAVLRVLLVRYAQLVSFGRSRVEPGGAVEADLRRARETDDAEVRRQRRRAAGYALLVGVAAFMLLAGWFQW